STALIRESLHRLVRFRCKPIRGGSSSARTSKKELTTNMRTYVIALVFSLLGIVSACGTTDRSQSFIGQYQNTLTIHRNGSVTGNDTGTISDGATSDLVFNSQNLGALRVTIVGASSFSIDQQQIMLNGQNGPFSATIQGQGTVVDRVFQASGTMSTSAAS